MSGIPQYIQKYIIKKHQRLTNNPPIHVYTNKINNNKLVFKMKDGYKLELQTPKIMKLFGTTKNINR